MLWRLALPGDQVRALPDNYLQAIASGRYATEFDPSHRERAFLPPDLFEPRGPWVMLTSFRGPAAPSHVSVFSGRSVFYVFLRLPGGRTATLDYLATLWHFPRPWPTEIELDRPLGRSFPLPLNPDLPQFPPGTQVALVRRLVLFDTEEKLMVTPVTENVQIRVYRETVSRDRFRAQDFFEFRMSRALLLEGEAGGLRPVAPGDHTFRIFGGHDVFERNIENGALKCRNCHSGHGIHSLRSAEALFPPRPLIRDPVEGEPGFGVSHLESWASLDWKENRHDWGLLTALRPPPSR